MFASVPSTVAEINSAEEGQVLVHHHALLMVRPQLNTIGMSHHLHMFNRSSQLYTMQCNNMLCIYEKIKVSVTVKIIISNSDISDTSKFTFDLSHLHLYTICTQFVAVHINFYQTSEISNFCAGPW